MNAVLILYNLVNYGALLDELEKLSPPAAQAAPWHKSVTSSYSRVTLSLNAEPHDTHLQVVLSVEGSQVTLVSVYCEDAKVQQQVELLVTQRISQHKLVWNTTHKASFAPDVLAAIEMADDIAKVATHQSQGDDFRPGNFSEITLENNVIKMTQKNHANARSIDHKKDYTMRELNVLIPLGEVAAMATLSMVRIGRLYVNLSDHSSPGRRAVGDAMQHKISELTR